MLRKLKELRKQYNLTTQDMANKLHISKPFYSQLENQNRRLTYDMAVRISEIFNMKPDDIFYEYYNIRKKGWRIIDFGIILC